MTKPVIRSVHLVPGLILTALLAVAGCTKQTTPASKPPPTQAELAAVPIVDKNVAARGGLDAWRAVHTMSLSGLMDAGKAKMPDALRASMDSRTAKVMARHAALETLGKRAQDEKLIRLPFTMDLERSRKMRVEVRFQGQTAVQVYDGAQGWKLRPFLGRHEVEAFTPEEARLAAEQQDLDGPLIDYAAKGSRIEVEGTEPVEGREAYKLKVTLASGQVRHVWVDTETSLDIKIDGTRRLDGKTRDVATYLRDYKAVDGLMIPHTLETVVDGVKGTEKINVDRVAINPNLGDGRFSKPL